jgi:ABC-2 type transport system permease protein
MHTIWIIAKREWRSMFLSPLAWTLLAVLFAIAAVILNAQLENYLKQMLQFQAFGQRAEFSLTDWTIAPMLGNTAVLLLLLMPLLTMRLISDEKRRDTWPALASSPVSIPQIILGKYLGLLFFLIIVVALLALQPALLFLYGQPDLGQVLSGLVGLFLVSATFGAVGLAASSITDNPLVAAVISFGVLLMLWIAGWWGESGNTPFEQTLEYLSLFNHYENFLQGVVSSADLIYFVLISLLGLLFAMERLAMEQING